MNPTASQAIAQSNADMAAAITVGAEHRISIIASARTYTVVITNVQPDRFAATDGHVRRTYLFTEISVIRPVRPLELSYVRAQTGAMATMRTELTADRATIGQVVFKGQTAPVAYEIIKVDLEGRHSFNGSPTVGVRKVGSTTKVPNCMYSLGMFTVSD